MQTIYGIDQKEGSGVAEAQKKLAHKIELSRELFTYLIFFITKNNKLWLRSLVV